MTITPQLAAYLSKQGVPQRYIKETDSKLYTTDINGVVKSLSHRGIFIYGSVGSGKTQLAVDILANLAESRKKETVVGQEVEYTNDTALIKDQVELAYDPKLFQYFNVPSLLIKIRGFFDDKSRQSVDSFLEELDEYEFIVLDDLGAEKPSEWVLETLYVLINNRYENMQKVIVTSNKSIEELAVVTGDRITSRMREMCKQIKLLGKDQRKG